MSLRIGINGFGRIGRLVVRAAAERNAPLEFVAVNDLTDARTLGHLLRYDSVHGPWLKAGATADGNLEANGRRISVLSEKDPAKLPWKSMNVDVVIEATGRFTDREGAAKHLTAGARGVLVTAPAKGADLTFVFGVNDQLFDKQKHAIISIGSCTTNCLAPVARVLHDTFGIEQGFMTTIHAYTNDQNILDLPHKDLRRARAAGINLIPTSTGAAKAIGLVLPELQGKLDGVAVRAPVPTGSVVDLALLLSQEVTRDEVIEAYRTAAGGPLGKYMQFSDDPLVSSDIVRSPYSCIYDSELTMANGKMAKVFGWYDNEWGYSCRLVDLIAMIGATLPVAAAV
jgi:glyceraldehyde 3-phosphate dehydrogenase